MIPPDAIKIIPFCHEPSRWRYFFDNGSLTHSLLRHFHYYSLLFCLLSNTIIAFCRHYYMAPPISSLLLPSLWSIIYYFTPSLLLRYFSLFVTTVASLLLLRHIIFIIIIVHFTTPIYWHYITTITIQYSFGSIILSPSLFIIDHYYYYYYYYHISFAIFIIATSVLSYRQFILSLLLLILRITITMGPQINTAAIFAHAWYVVLLTYVIRIMPWRAWGWRCYSARGEKEHYATEYGDERDMARDVAERWSMQRVRPGLIGFPLLHPLSSRSSVITVITARHTHWPSLPMSHFCYFTTTMTRPVACHEEIIDDADVYVCWAPTTRDDVTIHAIIIFICHYYHRAESLLLCSPHYAATPLRHFTDMIDTYFLWYAIISTTISLFMARPYYYFDALHAISILTLFVVSFHYAIIITPGQQ